MCNMKKSTSYYNLSLSKLVPTFVPMPVLLKTGRVPVITRPSSQRTRYTTHLINMRSSESVHGLNQQNTSFCLILFYVIPQIKGSNIIKSDICKNWLVKFLQTDRGQHITKMKQGNAFFLNLVNTISQSVTIYTHATYKGCC